MYKVIDINAGCRLLNRLTAMGILLNNKIEVINNDWHQPLIIKVKDSVFAIGKGMANKIIVEKL